MRQFYGLTGALGFILWTSSTSFVHGADEQPYDLRAKPVLYGAVGALVLADLQQEARDLFANENLPGSPSKDILERAATLLNKKNIVTRVLVVPGPKDLLELATDGRTVLLSWGPGGRAALIARRGAKFRVDEYPALRQVVGLAGLLEILKPMEGGKALVMEGISPNINATDPEARRGAVAEFQAGQSLLMPKEIAMGNCFRNTRRLLGEFRIKNVSKDMIVIKKITGSCSCIESIDCPGAVLGGQSAVVKFVFNPSIYSRADSFHAYIALETTDATTPAMVVEVKGTFDDSRYVFLSPNVEEFGPMSDGDIAKASCEVRLYAIAGRAEVRVIDTVKSDDAIVVAKGTPDSSRVGEFVEIARFHIRPALPRAIGPAVSQYVTFKTDDPVFRELTLELKLQRQAD